METKDFRSSSFPEQIEPLSRNLFDRYGTAIKTVVVGILVLLLLIPLAMIQSLIRERQRTKQDAITDITSKWGGEQTVAGPCLVIPYFETVVEDRKQIEIRRNLLLLPETLNVEGQATVEKRKRGIYDASVYTSEIRLSGEFDMAAVEKSGLRVSEIRWDEMQVIMGLSDLKGIKEKVQFEANGTVVDFESGLPVENLAQGYATGMYNYTENPYQLFAVGLNAQLNSLQSDALSGGRIPFDVLLKINGSQGLYVVPVGRTTTSQLKSNWATPSFDGNFLPENRTVSDAGFTADWKALDLNRSYGQVIRPDDSNAINQMAASRFGVRFIQPVDQYQQNMRSVKYAVLIILLTFVVVFFIELLKKKSVNPFQYLLVGLALVLFYTLLLSMSEVWGFNTAYWVAALMTASLIALHMASILKSRKQGILIGVLLTFLYLFIFVLIQMESYALLVGSLGLFAILAVIMYYSKKVKI